MGEHATYFQGAEVRLAAGLLFAAQHLDNLRRLELQLVGPAAELAGPPPEKRASYPRPGVYAPLVAPVAAVGRRYRSPTR